MTRMYLSPTATAIAKVFLVFAEFLIGLYNIVSFPIRKVTFKAFCRISLGACAAYALVYRAELTSYLYALGAALVLFAASIILSRLLYNVLKKKVSKKVAYLLNSPLSIPLNRFYRIENIA